MFKAQLNAIYNSPTSPLSSLLVAFIENGNLTLCETFGHRFIDTANPHKSLPTTLDTKYRIASISKLITSLGFMQLAERGEIDLDKDVSHYLGFSLRNPYLPTHPITSRMLLSHTSSLRDGILYSLPMSHTLQDFFNPLSPYYEDGAHWAKPLSPLQGMQFAPGHYFEYCNLGFGVLATILENISGTRFDQYMTQNIFAPLGLRCNYNVYTLLADSSISLAPLYKKLDGDDYSLSGIWEPQVDHYPNGIPSLDLSTYVPGANGTLFGPQGSLRASLLDLVEIMQLFMHNGTYKKHEFLKPSTLKDIFTPMWTYNPHTLNGNSYRQLITSYGLGAHLFPKEGLIGHLGDAYGLVSGFLMNPQTKNGLIYLIGGTSTDPEIDLGIHTAFSKCEEQILNLFLPLLTY